MQQSLSQIDSNNMNIRSKEELISYLDEGRSAKYIFFWGHQKSVGKVSKNCFSQWYDVSFSVDNITYKTAEHYMMAEKARLFHNGLVS